MSLTLERLKSLLSYDVGTGVFRWLVKRSRLAVPGSIAGSVGKNGYRYITIDGKPYLAHRLAIFFSTGVWPPDDTDHKSGGRDQNQLENLRPCTRGQNMQNVSVTSVVGAHFRKSSGRWRSQIKVDGKSVHLGFFNTAEEAQSAYRSAKARLHTFEPEVRVAR